MNFGIRLKEIIDSDKNYKSYNNFADVLHINRMTINRYVNEKYPVDFIEVLNKIYQAGINLNYLLTGEGSIMLNDVDRERLKKLEQQYEEQGEELKQLKEMFLSQSFQLTQTQKENKELKTELEEMKEENEALRVQSDRITALLAKKSKGMK